MNKEVLKNKVNELLSANEICVSLFHAHGYLNDFQTNPDNYEKSGSSYYDTWFKFLKCLNNNNLTIKAVDSYGGEDMGSEYWSVYEFKSLDTGATVLVKFEGWYASHVGSEYNSWKFVEPITVTRTEYQ